MSELQLKSNAYRLAYAMAQAPADLRKNMSQALARILATVSRYARRNAPKAFSTLTQAIGSRRLSDFEGIVFAGTNYARAAEEGTGLYGPQHAPSHKRPPVQSIEDWVRVRRIQPKRVGDTPRDLAFAISRKIAQTGTPAQPYLEPAFEQSQKANDQRIAAAIDATLAGIRA